MVHVRARPSGQPQVTFVRAHASTWRDWNARVRAAQSKLRSNCKQNRSSLTRHVRRRHGGDDVAQHAVPQPGDSEVRIYLCAGKCASGTDGAHIARRHVNSCLTQRCRCLIPRSLWLPTSKFLLDLQTPVSALYLVFLLRSFCLYPFSFCNERFICVFSATALCCVIRLVSYPLSHTPILHSEHSNWPWYHC